MTEVDNGNEVPQEYPRIRLLGEKTASELGMDTVRKLYPFTEYPIITTDFTVTPYDAGTPIEKTDEMIELAGGERVPLLLGYSYPNGVKSIDHHGPDKRLWRRISSANLALLYVQMMRTEKSKAVPGEGIMPPVLITHTDADSILASSILGGYLEPEERFGVAAIAADHTGEENDIADLLMAVQEKRDVAYSLHCLNALLKGKPLPDGAQELLDERKRDRERAYELIKSGAIEPRGNGVYLGKLTQKIAGELLYALLADAKVIVLASPLKGNEVKWDVKVRAGMQFPDGKSLQTLYLPNARGRWNALSSGRNDGTEDLEAFIHLVVEGIIQI